MSEKKSSTEHSKSICEAALEHYAALDDTLAEMIRAASIEVRDFMLLSFVCDQGSMSIEQLSRALGFKDETTQRCVDRLILAQLVHYNGNGSSPDGNHQIRATTAGKSVTRRIQSGNSD